MSGDELFEEDDEPVDCYEDMCRCYGKGAVDASLRGEEEL